jgi:hypothetical protein
MQTMKMRVTQVTFTPVHGALIAGEPVDDATKVVIAAADPAGAIPVALAVAAGIDIEVDPPEEAILEVLEKPR